MCYTIWSIITKENSKKNNKGTDTDYKVHIITIQKRVGTKKYKKKIKLKNVKGQRASPKSRGLFQVIHKAHNR